MTEKKPMLLFTFDAVPLGDDNLIVKASFGVDGEEAPRETGVVAGNVEHVTEASIELMGLVQRVLLAFTDFDTGRTNLMCRREHRSHPTVVQFFRCMTAAIATGNDDVDVKFQMGEEYAGRLQ